VRHLNEYISLDLEMGFIRDEQDVIDTQEELLRYIMAGLKRSCHDILESFGAAIAMPERIPRMHFLEALDIIASRGVNDAADGDISPEGEKVLCAHCEEHLGSSFVYVVGYPINKRPMYTMPDERLPGYTRSFDLLYRGIEITTGGQRINDYQMLRENIRAFGQNPADFREYLDVFKYGMPPHGGLGMGLERVTMKILNLKNIREATLFPRDMNRLSP
jgi:nondiscriminating aspartyl-tRNA synthetase